MVGGTMINSLIINYTLITVKFGRIKSYVRKYFKSIKI